MASAVSRSDSHIADLPLSGIPVLEFAVILVASLEEVDQAPRAVPAVKGCAYSIGESDDGSNLTTCFVPAAAPCLISRILARRKLSAADGHRPP